MPQFLKWMKHEIITILPAFLFFVIAFNLLHYSITLITNSTHSHFTSYFGATLGAIIAAKIILIVRNLPFINLFPHKLILFNVAWKLFIYGIAVLLVQILDSLVKHTYEYNITEAYSKLFLELQLPMFWGTQILILFLFLIFIVFSEFISRAGKHEMNKILLGKNKKAL